MDDIYKFQSVTSFVFFISKFSRSILSHNIYFHLRHENITEKTVVELLEVPINISTLYYPLRVKEFDCSPHQHFELMILILNYLD